MSRSCLSFQASYVTTSHAVGGEKRVELVLHADWLTMVSVTLSLNAVADDYGRRWEKKKQTRKIIRAGRPSCLFSLRQGESGRGDGEESQREGTNLGWFFSCSPGRFTRRNHLRAYEHLNGCVCGLRFVVWCLGVLLGNPLTFNQGDC